MNPYLKTGRFQAIEAEAAQAGPNYLSFNAVKG